MELQSLWKSGFKSTRRPTEVSSIEGMFTVEATSGHWLIEHRQSRKQDFVSGLLDFIKSSGLDSVLFLSGVDLSNRTDTQMLCVMAIFFSRLTYDHLCPLAHQHTTSRLRIARPSTRLGCTF